jgi:hypothetical protein
MVGDILVTDKLRSPEHSLFSMHLSLPNSSYYRSCLNQQLYPNPSDAKNNKDEKSKKENTQDKV